jgi:group I intron endonuclease
MIGIYRITSPSGKVYIGQSKNIERRFRQYRNRSPKKQRKLYNSFEKYGLDNHKFEIIKTFETEPRQDLFNQWEVLFWKHSFDLGQESLNVKVPGSNGRHSDETKRRISAGHKGKIMSEAAKQNLRERNLGHKPSEQTRLKLSKARKGKTYEEIYGKEKSDRVKLNQSISSKGKNKSEAHKLSLRKNKTKKSNDKDSKF